MVITAAHCLPATDPSTSPDWYFFQPVPSLYMGKSLVMPFGIWRSNSAFTDPLYRSTNPPDKAYDFAYIYINQGCEVLPASTGQCPRPGVTLAEALGGGLPIAWNEPQGAPLTMDQPWNQRSTCTNAVGTLTSNGPGPENYVIKCGLTDNQSVPISGDAWLDRQNNIASVVSGAATFVFLPNPIPQGAVYGTCLSSTCPGGASPSRAHGDFEYFEASQG
jgi:hypothetical protein